MIPIDYTGNLDNYNAFIELFKSNLGKWLKHGYIGNLTDKSYSKVETYYKKLDASLKESYIKIVGFSSEEEFMESIKAKKEIKAPESIITEEGREVLTMLMEDIDDIVNAKDEGLRCFIGKYQPFFLKDDVVDKHSPAYIDVYSAFVCHGYESKSFDKNTLWKATKVKVCPYCNRVYVAMIEFEKEGDKKGVVKGQLDHFYPKDKFPYLAISRYNLVPCCSYCNGSSGKHDEDPYKNNMVNPYSLVNDKGLRFYYKTFNEKTLDLEECENSIEIGVDTSSHPGMSRNDSVFHLEETYNAHRDIAAEIIYKYKAFSSKYYAEFINKLLNKSLYPQNEKELSLLYWGVSMHREKLGERPMAKFTIDLIDDLANRKEKK